MVFQRWAWGLVLCVWGAVGATEAPKEARPMAQDPVLEARLLAISEELRCLVCQNESLASSHAELAEDLRREVRSLIKEGKVTEGLLNMVEMAFRAYDPCFGCATHSLPGQMPLEVTIRGPGGGAASTCRASTCRRGRCGWR